MTTEPEPDSDSDSPRRTGQQRLGGRSERVIRDVLRATVTELARVGYAALRIDDVAAHAGVNKTTVYRRWPTKPELVTAALSSMNEAEREPPDTGAVRTDLLGIMRELTGRFSSCEGQAVSRMIALEMAHPEVAAIARTLREEVQAPAIAAVKRGIARGELPRGSDAQLITEVVMGTIMSRKYRRREAIDDEFLLGVVNLVVTGAVNGGAVRKATRPSKG